VILEDSFGPREPTVGLLAQTPNALTISRFALAAAWIAFATAAPDAHLAFTVFAVVAATTDFIDGRIARRLGVAYSTGGWLDSVADVTFVLSALGCYAMRRELPIGIPVLIAISFTQYTIDSLWMHRANAPVRSRLGHWGGIVNYALVIAMALTAGSSLRPHITQLIPLIELFYIAAVVERAILYQHLRK
jgi:phosphatidylglycerophosphate synthase